MCVVRVVLYDVVRPPGGMVLDCFLFPACRTPGRTADVLLEVNVSTARSSLTSNEGMDEGKPKGLSKVGKVPILGRRKGG